MPSKEQWGSEVELGDNVEDEISHPEEKRSSVQCNLISETKASGSGERYITYEQTPSRPESTASLKYHLVAVPLIRDLVQGRKYSLISFIAEAQQCFTL